MNKLTTNPEYKVTSKWYSFVAKNQYINAKKCYYQFNYPFAIKYAQESFEFAGKSILKLHNMDCDKNHDFSKIFINLQEEHPQYIKTIRRICQNSKKWLNPRDMTDSQYGTLGISPEILYGRKEVKEIISISKNTIEFLNKIERANKTEIQIGILNGKVFGNKADKFPLDGGKCNNFDKEEWIRLIKSDLNYNNSRLNIIEIPISKLDSSTDVVINPFGEIFPSDENPVEILDMIFKYISAGGTFINLGGLPFWASHNVRNKEKKSHVSAKYYGGSFLSSTLSWQMFDIKTTSDTQTNSGPYPSTFFQNQDDKRKFGDLEQNIQIKEYRGLKQENIDITPIIRINRPDFGEIYPICLKKIDLGYLFLVSLDIQTREETQLIINSIDGFLNWMY